MPTKKTRTAKRLTAAQKFRLKAQDLVVVLWSERQQGFHYDELGRVLRNGLITYHSQRRPDWIPVAIADTWEEADEIAEAMILERRFRKPNRVIH